MPSGNIRFAHSRLLQRQPPSVGSRFASLSLGPSQNGSPTRSPDIPGRHSCYMKPNFIDHLSLIVKDLDRTEEFYSKFLGNPILRNETLLIYKISNIRLYFKLSSKRVIDSKYDKDSIGMNHIGLGVRTLDELKEFERHLSEVGVKHSEFKVGKFGNEYIWFDDPNGIRLEIYHRPEE